MTITLYSGVELRSDYSIVFDTDTSFWGTNTPFKKYLDDKAFYTEELDDVYFTNDGSISISWPVYRRLAENITYMRIFTEQNEIKYFFIDSYEYRNEVLILNYTLDVWHTYSNGMKIHSGVVDRARYHNGRRTLPIAYQTDTPFIFNGTENEFYIVAEFQVYRLTKNAQEATDRFSYTSLVGHRAFAASTKGGVYEHKPETTINVLTEFTYTMEEAIETINELVAHQGVAPVNNYEFGSGGWSDGGYTDAPEFQKALKNDLGIHTVEFPDTFPEKIERDIRYEIIQIYAVPTNVLSDDTFNTAYHQPTRATILILDTILPHPNTEAGEEAYVDFNFLEYTFTEIKNEVATKDFIIPENDKIVGVGFPSMFVPFGFTGKERKIQFRTETNAFGFNISLLGEEGISDITSHLAIPIPFTTPSGQERQIAALNKTTAKWQVGTSIASLAMNALSFARPIGGAVKDLASAAASGYHLTQEGIPFLSATLGTAVEYQKMFNPLGPALKQTGKNLLFDGSGIGFLYQGTSLLNSINSLKSPVSSGAASDSEPIALINALLGFSTYTIIPSNEAEVDHLISRIGYNTWIKTNDYHHDNDKSFLTNKYEPISFATLQISGKFPNNISSSLENILIQGTLISYNPNIFDII